MVSESSAAVGESKTVRNDSSTSKAFLMRAINCVPSNECPPRKKKLSSMPTFSRPSSSPRIVTTRFSTAVRGAT